MGFEQEVPPVPDRVAELHMLNKLEQSWLDQPFYRYYMQEDLRKAKMNYTNYNMRTRNKFLTNCLFFSLFTLPLAYLARRFYIYNSFRTSGIPFTKKLPYFRNERTNVQERTRESNLSMFGIWFGSTLLFSVIFTNWSFRSDEMYDLFSKSEKML